MTFIDELRQTPDGNRLFQQERSIVETTEMICELMHEQSVSRRDLATRIGKSKGYVSQLLDGTRNLTIRTISDVFLVLGYHFHPAKSASHSPTKRQHVPTSPMTVWSKTPYPVDAPNDGTPGRMVIPFAKEA